MDTSSVQFLGFTAIVAVLYNLFRAPAWRQTVLFAANVFFLSSVSKLWTAYVPLGIFLAFGYAGVRLMKSRTGRNMFPAFAVLLVLVFVALKRYDFVPHQFLIQAPYITLGLSYIMFRVLHMLVDAKEGSLPDGVSPLAYLNYTLNFTTLVAGPIQLYGEFAASRKCSERSILNSSIVLPALERITFGFFKLRILCLVLTTLHSSAVRQMLKPQGFVAGTKWGMILLVSYPANLYLNFSGYVDMVIGIAALIGIQLPENFNRPFSATGYIEFWNKWHMTLSNWLKTYVYTPLLKTLMYRFPAETLEPYLGVLVFFVTFFLVGAWHGTTSEFLFFGLLQGLGVSLNKMTQIATAKKLGRKRAKALESTFLYRSVARGLTTTYFALTLLWFWADWHRIHQMVTATGTTASVSALILAFAVATLALVLWEQLRVWVLGLQFEGSPFVACRSFRAGLAAYLGIMAWLLLGISSSSTPVMYGIF